MSTLQLLAPSLTSIVTHSCDPLRADPPPLSGTAPDFSGLEAAIRLKSALLHALASSANADWQNHVARFAADLRSAHVHRTTLVVLLTELREELRLLILGVKRPSLQNADVGAFPPESWVTLTADDVVGEFQREMACWAVPRGTPEFTSPLTGAVAAFLEEHYAEPLTLEHVAAALGRSQRHLAAVFRRQMGITVHEHLTQLRLRAAMRLIRQGDKIEAVSLLVGYRSKRNFYRRFKEQLGVTPLAYKTALSRILPPT